MVVGTFGNFDYTVHAIDCIREGNGMPQAAFLGFPGAVAGIVISLFDLRGPADTISGGCPSGMDAVGFASRQIQNGVIDAAVVIGTDNEFCEVTYNGIAAANGLSCSFNNEPCAASRPFDLNRGGNVIGENACAIILERESHAQQRKAPRVYARVAGYSKTSTGTRVYSHDKPSLVTDASERALQAVLADARWAATDVHLVSANGSASKSYDRLEANSIASVFGHSTPVVSIKGLCGQSGSGCILLQIAAACLSLQQKEIFGTKNFETPDPQLPAINIIRQSQKAPHLKRVICQAIALGGFHYSCLALEEHSLSSKL